MTQAQGRNRQTGAIPWNRLWRGLLFFGIPALAVYLLLVKLGDVEDLWSLLQELDWRWVLLGTVAYLLGNLSRTLRLLIVMHLPQRSVATAWRLLTAVLALSLSNQVLPARTGELSFLYYANRGVQADPGDALGGLILARLTDIMAILMLFLSAVVLSPNLAGVLGSANLRLVLLALAVTTLVLGVLLNLDMGRLGRLGGFFEGLSGGRFEPTSGIVNAVKQSAATIQQARNPSTLALAFLFALGVWLANFAMLYAFLVGVGIRLPLADAVVGMTVAALTNVLPVSGVGNVGTLEAGWALGFTVVGLSTDLAIASGFAIHILAFGDALLLGIPSLILIQLSRRMPDRPSGRAPV
jgi:uncharacterized protein (TIRG00374 family)